MNLFALITRPNKLPSKAPVGIPPITKHLKLSITSKDPVAVVRASPTWATYCPLTDYATQLLYSLASTFAHHNIGTRILFKQSLDQRLRSRDPDVIAGRGLWHRLVLQYCKLATVESTAINLSEGFLIIIPDVECIDHA